MAEHLTAEQLKALAEGLADYTGLAFTRRLYAAMGELTGLPRLRLVALDEAALEVARADPVGRLAIQDAWAGALAESISYCLSCPLGRVEGWWCEFDGSDCSMAGVSSECRLGGKAEW